MNTISFIDIIELYFSKASDEELALLKDKLDKHIAFKTLTSDLITILKTDGKTWAVKHVKTITGMTLPEALKYVEAFIKEQNISFNT